VELLDGMRSRIPDKRGRIGSILMMKKGVYRVTLL
jgi:hypothetical protein